MLIIHTLLPQPFQIIQRHKHPDTEVDESEEESKLCGEWKEEDEVEIADDGEGVGSDSVEIVVVLEDISVLEPSGVEHGETVEQAPDHTESDDIDDVVSEKINDR